MFRLFLLTVVAVLIALPETSVADGHEQKAVLITGATTGIGRMAAERLAEAGYFVYAGARKQKDMDELNAIDNIMAVRLDVTVQEDIDAAVELIEKEGRGLWGLVNNAGVNVIDPLIEADESDLEWLFDVNVYGVFRVTKAFAPMIIESRGRIVNISSIAGVLSGGLTGYGMYVMSKHAVEAFTDQLAWEMMPLGVSVSAVEPGNFQSQIGESRCRRMRQNQANKTYRYYAEDMAVYIDLCQQRAEGKATSSGPSPEPVAAAIEHALFAEQPKEHYLVTGDPMEARLTLGKAIEEAAQLNHSHEHSLSRDELVEMLDNEIAIAGGEQPRGMPGFYDGENSMTDE
ncbi:MAG: SDR family oxidoreductase [Woeseiaceae bacterium]|nr:SDR family oxidoreductase [Woeseiaceae bacterium]